VIWLQELAQTDGGGWALLVAFTAFLEVLP